MAGFCVITSFCGPLWTLVADKRIKMGFTSNSYTGRSTSMKYHNFMDLGLAARHLLQLAPLPSVANLPKPTLPPLPTIPALQQPTLPNLPTPQQPSLPNPTLPPLPNLPTNIPTLPKVTALPPLPSMPTTPNIPTNIPSIPFLTPPPGN